jgi:putative nucleotidyltransferase with HDIG domain
MTNKKFHLKRLLFGMASLVDLGQEATSSKDLSEKTKAALYIITGMFSVPSASLFLYNPQRKQLEIFISKGHREKAPLPSRISILPEDLKRFRMNDPHTTRDAAQNPLFRRDGGPFADKRTKIFLPLFAKGEFIGAITLGRRLGGASFRGGDKDLLRVIAHQMAITLYNARLFLEVSKKAAENKRLYTSLQRIYHDTIQAFAAAIDAKDEYTRDHSYRVACYAVAIARELGWKKRDIEGLYIAGLLHDIGKIIIDVKVIRKGQTLSTPEMSEIRKHPQISYNILSKIKFPWKNIEDLVLHHHERLDGTGYPGSLKAADLSDGAKILALADAFDAMTSDRPYRSKMALDDACQEVLRCQGTQFDERITKTFFGILRRELNGESREQQILPLLASEDSMSVRTPAIRIM